MARPDDVRPEAELDEDAEALSWAGDVERGRDAPRLAADSPSERVEEDAERPSRNPATTDISIPAAVAPALRRNPLRILVGILFGVVYLALTVGWINSVQITSPGTTDLLTGVLWQFGEFTAILVAPLWYATAMRLTRRTVVTLGWLLLGTGLLIPWPYFGTLMVGA